MVKTAVAVMPEEIFRNHRKHRQMVQVGRCAQVSGQRHSTKRPKRLNKYGQNLRITCAQQETCRQKVEEMMYDRVCQWAACLLESRTAHKEIQHGKLIGTKQAHLECFSVKIYYYTIFAEICID